MRIVSWNCCLKLAAKYDHVAQLKPDILIVQECEQLPFDVFPEAHYHWVGHDKKKGLGVLTFGEKAEIDPSFNPNLDYFLPLVFESGLKLLGVWSFTHRAEKRFGVRYKGHVSDALSTQTKVILLPLPRSYSSAFNKRLSQMKRVRSLIAVEARKALAKQVRQICQRINFCCRTSEILMLSELVLHYDATNTSSHS